jgi:glycosyltransferase involved in cell wall biosynthesis
VRAAAVIPAYNEAETVRRVVEAALLARRVDDVIVVDNASTDDTSAVAAAAGARVIHCPEPGKGQAMAAGVAATDADVIVFLDADLVGLLPEHIDRLATGVLSGRVGMSCGLFDRGPVVNPAFLKVLPILTGQRAVRRDIFCALHYQDQKGYKIEAALNSLVADLGEPVESFVCKGLWHRTKEEKYPSAIEGFVRKQGMLLTVVAAYAGYRLRKHLRQRRALRPPPS